MITVDAMKKSSETDQIPLKWVGMEKIILPVHLLLAGQQTNIIAEFDIFVNLVNPSKGIHMSRLYELLTLHTQKESLTTAGIRSLLRLFVESQNGLSTEAKITVSLNIPVTETTLKSQRQYFKSIPLKFVCVLNSQGNTSELKFKLEYSSTCPQSAALAHQLTIAELEKQSSRSGADLTAWYAQRGFIATPHAQRSDLELSVVVTESFELSDFAGLFIDIEHALGTPTQGIVKREDEQ